MPEETVKRTTGSTAGARPAPTAGATGATTQSNRPTTATTVQAEDQKTKNGQKKIETDTREIMENIDKAISIDDVLADAGTTASGNTSPPDKKLKSFDELLEGLNSELKDKEELSGRLAKESEYAKKYVTELKKEKVDIDKALDAYLKKVPEFKSAIEAAYQFRDETRTTLKKVMEGITPTIMKTIVLHRNSYKAKENVVKKQEGVVDTMEKALEVDKKKMETAKLEYEKARDTVTTIGKLLTDLGTKQKDIKTRETQKEFAIMYFLLVPLEEMTGNSDVCKNESTDFCEPKYGNLLKDYEDFAKELACILPGIPSLKELNCSEETAKKQFMNFVTKKYHVYLDSMMAMAETDVKLHQAKKRLHMEKAEFDELKKNYLALLFTDLNKVLDPSKIDPAKLIKKEGQDA